MMLDVLVASSAVGFMRGSRRAYNSCLASSCSKIALNDDIGFGHPRHLRHPRAAARRPRAALAGSRKPFRRNSSFARCNAGSINLRLWSCKVTVKPRNADQAAMSPPITPGTDHVDVFDVRGAFASQGFQTILQEEHTNQVARGVSSKQVCDRPRLGLEGLRATAPYRDQRSMIA